MTASMRLEGGVVLVTGGAIGTARATALLCAEEGASVVIAGSDVASGRELQSQIESGGGAAAFVEVDPASEESIQTMVGEAIMAFGRLQFVVTNPSHSGTGDALSLSVDAWDATLARELRGAWLTCKYAMPFVKSAGGGALVHVACTEAFRTPARGLLAAATHSAILALARSLAVDYGAHGIRVNAVCAGYIQTEETERDIAAAVDPEVELKRILSTHPLGRVGKPEDVAHAVVFLLSREAAFITGATLVVDGGRSLVGPDRPS